MYCSPNCRAKFYRQEAAKERSREIACENCGKTFITTRSDVKYCCDECRYEGQLKGQRIRNAENRAKKKEQAVLVIPPSAEVEREQKTA